MVSFKNVYNVMLCGTMCTYNEFSTEFSFPFYLLYLNAYGRVASHSLRKLCGKDNGVKLIIISKTWKANWISYSTKLNNSLAWIFGPIRYYSIAKHFNFGKKLSHQARHTTPKCCESLYAPDWFVIGYSQQSLFVKKLFP